MLGRERIEHLPTIGQWRRIWEKKTARSENAVGKPDSDVWMIIYVVAIAHHEDSGLERLCEGA